MCIRDSVLLGRAEGDESQQYEYGDDAQLHIGEVVERFEQARLSVEDDAVSYTHLEKDGRLTNVQVLSTPDRSLSEEAVRVLQLSPRWSPGKQRNQPVRIKYTLPVDFRIQN